MREEQIRAFWDTHPCGETKVGGLASKRDYEQFFREYDAYRYSKEAHIPRCLDRIQLSGKQVLEIGLGQGTDSEQLIRRGAIWSGLDLSRESVQRVQRRLILRGLPYQAIKEGSVLDIPYRSHSFDLVFSHGVLHHVPGVREAQREIHRVLKPSGELIVMLYARWSLNYLVSIRLVRRLGLLGLYALGMKSGGMIGQHLENARQIGLWRYLSMSEFIHRNTDGPLNPYSRVYDLRAVRREFRDFQVTRAYKRFMHAPPLPVRHVPLARLLGWNLWVHMRPRQLPTANSLNRGKPGETAA